MRRNTRHASDTTARRRHRAGTMGTRRRLVTLLAALAVLAAGAASVGVADGSGDGDVAFLSTFGATWS